MKSIRSIKLFDTYGRISIASLFVCGLTGVFLVVPYDPVKAYLSVTAFVTSNPAASLTRNLHYWSAQLFLIFTILHFIDHFRSTISLNSNSEPGKGRITRGIWLRLVISLMVVFYIMLSGFILKDDADSRQAHLLLTSLLSSLPLAGDFISSSLAGKSESLITVYLHHAATATIVIFIVIFEHVREVKVKWPTFIYTTIFILVLSLFLRAPLAQQDESIMKGPWYFIGVQELLHQFTDPLIVVIILLSVLTIIYFVPFLKENLSSILRKLVWVSLVFYVLLIITGYFFRGPYYQWQLPFSDSYEAPVTLNFKPVFTNSLYQISNVEVNGRIEGCMSCHKGMKGLSVSHDPEVMGCYNCHGGDPYTLNANAAHKRMFKVPGNLSNSKITCGKSGCHESIVERLPQSMMASLSGMISVDKWVFGENQSPDGNYKVSDIGTSPADIHLRNLCAGCHLGMEKTKPGKAEWLERGGGCNACHLTYTKDNIESLNQIKKMKSTGYLNATTSKGNSSTLSLDNLKKLTHPSIDLNITNDKCESCHSRSGRISMSYAGWHETNLSVLPNSSKDYKKLPDGRIFIKQPEDVHHKAGMLCIDCHGSFELMGDGKLHQHKEEAVKITCQDCHNSDTTSNRFAPLSETDRESQLIGWIRGWSNEKPKVLITEKETMPVINVWFNNKESPQILLSKTTTKVHQLKPPLPQCIKDNAHKRLSCETCHTAWVPQCIGCHNSYEKETMGYDMLKRKPRKGTWVEYNGEALADLPVLGIKNSNQKANKQRVGIFAPGMIMTTDKSHRLYAPVSGHTTQRASRSCVSCHLNPLALGYGRGTLELLNDGNWIFTSVYALSKYDNLPEDAWTGFLQERKDQSVTRLNMRPFNLHEQKRILQAGACLTCHDAKSAVIKNCLNDFDQTIKQASPKCITTTLLHITPVLTTNAK